MSTEKMREEFEAETLKIYEGADLVRADKGYRNAHIQSAWWGWRTSRAVIEVELPKPYESYGCMGEGMGEPDYSIAYEDAVEAIESLGLKVKP